MRKFRFLRKSSKHFCFEKTREDILVPILLYVLRGYLFVPRTTKTVWIVGENLVNLIVVESECCRPLFRNTVVVQTVKLVHPPHSCSTICSLKKVQLAQVLTKSESSS